MKDIIAGNKDILGKTRQITVSDVTITRERIQKFAQGTLPLRPLGKPIHKPSGEERIAQIPLE